MSLNEPGWPPSHVYIVKQNSNANHPYIGLYKDVHKKCSPYESDKT